MPENTNLAALQNVGLVDGVGDLYAALMTTEDTTTSAPAYGDPELIAEVVDFQLTYNYAEGNKFASNRAIRKIRRLTGIDLSTTYPRMLGETRRKYFGRGVDANGGELVGDSMSPLCAIGICETRDDDTCLMRWILKIRLTEGNVSGKTREDGTIEYNDPTLEGSATKLSYVYTDGDNKQWGLFEYVADTAEAGCKWTRETFFAAVRGPWSEAQPAQAGG